MLRARQFTLLTSKCASRHNGVHFFDIATSKSGPKVVCFVHFDLEMCFATFKSVLKLRCLYILTWKCASRHNGVLLFISHLASWLRTRRFKTSLLFDPPEPQIIGKTQCFATFDFPTFSRTWIFFLLTISLSSSLLFSDSSHLCFSSVHIVGSLTSKLPSIIVLPTLKMIARWCHGPLGLPKLPKTSRCSKQIQTHSTQTLEILGSPCRRRTPMGSIAGRTSGTCDLSCSPHGTMSRVRPTKWCWTLEPMESPKRWKDELPVGSDGKVWQVYASLGSICSMFVFRRSTQF